MEAFLPVAGENGQWLGWFVMLFWVDGAGGMLVGFGRGWLGWMVRLLSFFGLVACLLGSKLDRLLS